MEKNLNNERVISEFTKKISRVEYTKENPFLKVGVKKIRISNYMEFEKAMEKGVPIYKETITMPSGHIREIYYIIVSFDAILNAAF